MEENNFGKVLNSVRKERGLTAEKLAELCNINTVYLQQIEGGKKTPSIHFPMQRLTYFSRLFTTERT